MLPFPSSYYLRDDPTTPTGKRVALSSQGLPKTRWPHRPFDPTSWNENDGFSTIAPLIFTLGPNSINSSSLIGHDRIDQSIKPADASTTTLLLDVTDPTHPTPIPHFVEVDSFMHGDRFRDDRFRVIVSG
jgi:hypothetical protein